MQGTRGQKKPEEVKKEKGLLKEKDKKILRRLFKKKSVFLLTPVYLHKLSLKYQTQSV